MNLEIDATAKALYLRIAAGRVADSIEIADSVVMDVDKTDNKLGIEFVHAEDFGPFLREHPEAPVLPSRLTYVSLDRGTSWEVETGTANRPAEERARVNADLNAELVGELILNPSLLDRIPQGATLIPLRSEAPHLSPEEALGVAGQIAQSGGVPVLQPLGVPPPERPEWENTHVANIRYGELTPRRPADPRTIRPTLRYYRDTDLLVVDLVSGREAKPEYGQVVPIRTLEFGLLLVELETELVIGRLLPRFLSSIAHDIPKVRAWLAQAETRDETPADLLGVLEDIDAASVGSQEESGASDGSESAGAAGAVARIG